MVFGLIALRWSDRSRSPENASQTGPTLSSYGMVTHIQNVTLLRQPTIYCGYWKSPRRIRYTDVTDTVQREVRNDINLSLITRFNAALPDPLVKISLNDINTICKPTWDAMHK